MDEGHGMFFFIVRGFNEVTCYVRGILCILTLVFVFVWPGPTEDG